MKSPIRHIAWLAIFLLIFTGIITAQQKKKPEKESIIRKGVIDVESIDKNKDGKVFQDPMDWNVISDKPGKCPLCKMNLEQVTTAQAKENLKKNGFKVKK